MLDLLAFSETLNILLYFVFLLGPAVCALSGINSGYWAGVHSNTESEGW